MATAAEQMMEYYYQTGVIDGYRTAAKIIAEDKLRPQEMMRLFTELAVDMAKENEFLKIAIEQGVTDDATH